MSVARLYGYVLLAATLLGCAGDDAMPKPKPEDCLAPLALDCVPAYEPPTYDAIYDNILRPTCGASGTGSQCHGPDGGQSGLFLSDREEAYDYLLGNMDSVERVIAGDPECSRLMQRVESSDASFRMPLGSQALSAGERCALAQWIADGAKRH